MVTACPQNRSTGSPFVGQEPGMAVWLDPHHRVQREPLGMLRCLASPSAAVHIRMRTHTYPCAIACAPMRCLSKQAMD